jgi:hypothetical protein
VQFNGGLGGLGVSQTLSPSIASTVCSGGNGIHNSTDPGGGGGYQGNANGTANTGGGAAGGAVGGSGAVILMFPKAFTITFGAGLVGSTTTVGANKVATITSGSGNISFS